MDSFQACQFLQKFIGKSSSSAAELLELFSALVPISDVLTNPKAPENVLATATNESASILGGGLNQFTPAFPVQVSKEALASIFDISSIAIDVKIAIFHHYWIQRLMRICLSETLANIVGTKGSPGNMPPINIRLSFRFVENFDVECYEASVTDGEEASTMGLQSLMNHLPVKPIFALDWGIHKYDPKPARTDPPGFIESQIPRLVGLMKTILKRAVRVQRSKDRAALLYTPRILNHIQTRISALESRSQFHSEGQNDKVKQLRSKLDMFYASPAFRVQATMDNIAGMVNPTQAVKFAESIGSVVHPDQAISLTNIGSTGKFNLTSARDQSLERFLPLAGDKSSSGHAELSEIQPTETPIKGPIAPQTRITMLNFKLPDILQAMLLAVVTEAYCVLLKYPTRLNSIFDHLFAAFLDHVKPDHSQNANFSLSGPSLRLDMPSLPPFNAAMGLSPRVNLPGMPDSLDSIMKPALPLHNILSASTSKTNPLPLARLPSLMASKAVSPMILRSVSWGTNSSESECDTGDLDPKESTAELKNRKLLPKSPKPKAQFSMSMKNAAISKPPLEPIQLISESFKDHSKPVQVKEGVTSSLEKHDSDKEN
ncbi:hypothetical protein PTTG_11908 [Puccinia triticina 1-1 BBBD Race 1]|uniref:Uncharacterized protein n=1 Tax=Puccinia triticina (isolate 1-1 / race 1 (BBBD)) TaxID=630390 RepID=A0A180GTK4_PUCT1|nr:hypothetical protein PTTG_11908 [Puccinia triticina 1-1 BBBD Race 1]